MFDGDRLSESRKLKNLTQKELAATLGISEDSLSNYERGINVPSDKILVEIARFFDTSLDYFFGLTNQEISFNRIDAGDLPSGFPKELMPKLQEHAQILFESYKYQAHNK